MASRLAPILLAALFAGCATAPPAPPAALRTAPSTPVVAGPVGPVGSDACVQTIFEAVSERFNLPDDPVTQSYALRRLGVRVRVTVVPGAGLVAPSMARGSGDEQYDRVVFAAVIRTLGDPAAQAGIARVCTRPGSVVMRFSAADSQR
jgi:hypothetical protein